MPAKNGRRGVFGTAENLTGAVPSEPQYTGRYLVLITEDDGVTAEKSLAKAAGLKAVARSADFKTQDFTPEAVADADAVVLSEIGVMVVDGDAKGVEMREPEQVCYAIQAADTATGLAASADYVRGYRDGVDRLKSAPVWYRRRNDLYLKACRRRPRPSGRPPPKNPARGAAVKGQSTQNTP
ncbi:MAG: hypothetical protein QGF53_09735, partial [Alphaproteobacteria bacterium]|nr:hypothetical protein [Alphaproteobacteria bacterium]